MVGILVGWSIVIRDVMMEVLPFVLTLFDVTIVPNSNPTKSTLPNE